jgi:hypothetical protein
VFVHPAVILAQLGIDIPSNVLSLSFQFCLSKIPFLYRYFCSSTTRLVFIPNSHSVLRISTWCRNCVNFYNDNILNSEIYSDNQADIRNNLISYENCFRQPEVVS